NLQYRGTTISILRADVALGPSQAALTHGMLQLPDQGQAQFDLTAGLKNWSYTPQSPLRANLTAARLNIGTLERIANTHFPVSGALAAHIALRGSQTNPAGQGSVTITQATAWNEPIQSLALQFQGEGTRISTKLQVSAPAASGSGRLVYDFRAQSYDAQL